MRLLVGVRTAHLRRARAMITLAMLCGLTAESAGAQHGPFIAVSNEMGHTITLIDARSLSVVKTIPVPQRPRRLGFSPNGKEIFVALSDPQKRVQTGGDAIVSLDVVSGQIEGVF